MLDVPDEVPRPTPEELLRRLRRAERRIDRLERRLGRLLRARDPAEQGRAIAEMMTRPRARR